jgi:hypothetical protein
MRDLRVFHIFVCDGPYPKNNTRRTLAVDILARQTAISVCRVNLASIVQILKVGVPWAVGTAISTDGRATVTLLDINTIANSNAKLD